MKLFTRSMKLFAPFFCCCILLTALASRTQRLRERWRLQVRMRVGADADARARRARPAVSAAGAAPAPAPATDKELQTPPKPGLQPVDNGTGAPAAGAAPTIRVSLRRAPAGFVDSPGWDYESATRLLALAEAGSGPLYRQLMRQLGMRRQFGYSEEYNARRPDGDELKGDAMVEVTNWLAAELPAPRLSVKRLRKLLMLRAQYDRQMPTTRRPTFSWKTHLSKRRTVKRVPTTGRRRMHRSRGYVFYSRGPSGSRRRGGTMEEVLSDREDQGDGNGTKPGDEEYQEYVIDETPGDNLYHSKDNKIIDDTLGDHGNQSEAFNERNRSKGIDEVLSGRRTTGELKEIIDDRQDRIEIQDDRQDRTEIQDGGQNQTEILDDGQNQEEIQDDDLDDNLNQSDALGGQPTDHKTLDEGTSNRQNQSDVQDEVLEDKQNKGKVDEGYVNKPGDEVFINKPGDELDEGLNQGDAIDKVLYAALSDRRNQGHGLENALNSVLGTGGRGEELNKAIDEAMIDKQDPSEALDRALHETLGIRAHQSDQLDKAIDAALQDGNNIEEGFKGGLIEPGDGNDYRRAFDADDIDTAQLYNELSIDDTNDDDVIHKVFAAAMDTDHNDHKAFKSISTNVSSASNVASTNDVSTTIALITIQNTTAIEFNAKVTQNDDESKITFFKNNFDDENRIYVDE